MSICFSSEDDLPQTPKIETIIKVENVKKEINVYDNMTDEHVDGDATEENGDNTGAEQHVDNTVTEQHSDDNLAEKYVDNNVTEEQNYNVRVEVSEELNQEELFSNSEHNSKQIVCDIIESIIDASVQETEEENVDENQPNLRDVLFLDSGSDSESCR